MLIKIRQAAPVISPIYDTGADKEDVVRRYVEYHENIRQQRAGRTIKAPHYQGPKG